MRPELSEAAFRRWEKIITYAVNIWPAPYIFYPTPQQPKTTTCVARLRDALLSHHRNNWTPTSIDMLKWQQVKDEITVSHTNENAVRIGPRMSAPSHAMTAMRPTLSVLPIDLSGTLNPEQRLNIYTWLCSLRALEVLPTIELTNVPKQDIGELENTARHYDVGLIPNDNGLITII